MAAHYFFHNEDIELICCSTFEEVFATVKDDSTILGMAAIEIPLRAACCTITNYFATAD